MERHNIRCVVYDTVTVMYGQVAAALLLSTARCSICQSLCHTPDTNGTLCINCTQKKKSLINLHARARVINDSERSHRYPISGMKKGLHWRVCSHADVQVASRSPREAGWQVVCATVARGRPQLLKPLSRSDSLLWVGWQITESVSQKWQQWKWGLPYILSVGTPRKCNLQRKK